MRPRPLFALTLALAWLARPATCTNGSVVNLCITQYSEGGCVGTETVHCADYADQTCYVSNAQVSFSSYIFYDTCDAATPSYFALVHWYFESQTCSLAEATGNAYNDVKADGSCNNVTLGGQTTSFTIACPSSSSKCFPASATVELEDGSHKTMAQLAIGDKVLATTGEYSPVYMFSHRVEAAKAAFVTIEAGATTTPLQLTPDHYMYVKGVLAAASTVKVGDEITLADGSKAAVTKVHTTWAQGLYNPHTMHGDIVVNGVQTSTYTQGIAPALAHAALWPVRAMYAAGVNVADESTFATGSQLLADVLPNGKAKY